jgi:hypothetical protein
MIKLNMVGAACESVGGGGQAYIMSARPAKTSAKTLK